MHGGNADAHRTIFPSLPKVYHVAPVVPLWLGFHVPKN
jgi:hypothetical protein